MKGPSASSHTQCVARASRDWIPRLSIPRAKILMTVCLEELVSACSVNSETSLARMSDWKQGAIHPSRERLGFLASSDKPLIRS